MVPGWIDREQQRPGFRRREPVHAHRCDGPASVSCAVRRRMGTFRLGLAARGRHVIWWSGRHAQRLASLPTQIWTLRTFGMLDYVARGGLQ